MATLKLLTGSLSTVLSTELNSLADEANKLSSSIANGTDLYLYDEIELVLNTFGSTPDAGACVEIYLVSSIDGTNYPEGSDSIDSPASSLVGVINIRAATTAQRNTIRDIPLPSGSFKYLVINKTGQSFNASGNTLKRKPYTIQSV